jgi:hypothetical protein
VGWPPTFLALPRDGRPTRAATDGSSSRRPPTRPDASTAAWVSSRTPPTPRLTASAEPRSADVDLWWAGRVVRVP